GPGGRAAGNNTPAAAYTDIVQGKTDNCYFLAALSSDALTNADLQGRIIHQPGTNKYSVQLFNREGKPDPQTVTFNGTWNNSAPMEPQSGEYWTILYWKAFSQQMGNALSAATETDAWIALTGKTPQFQQLSSASAQGIQAAAKSIQAALAGGNNVTVT